MTARAKDARQGSRAKKPEQPEQNLDNSRRRKETLRELPLAGERKVKHPIKEFPPIPHQGIPPDLLRVIKEGNGRRQRPVRPKVRRRQNFDNSKYQMFKGKGFSVIKMQVRDSSQRKRTQCNFPIRYRDRISRPVGLIPCEPTQICTRKPIAAER